VVKKAMKDVTQKFVNSLPADDISILSDRDGMCGMMNVTLQQLYAHTDQKYIRPTQDYIALAKKHRGLLAAAQQV